MPIPPSVNQEEWDVFLAETQDQLTALEEATLRLERGDADTELLREMFRLAHTIKGSSAAVGLESMTALTHSIETLLDKLRNGQIEVRRPLVDAFFLGWDLLNRLVILPTLPEGTEEPLTAPLLEQLERLSAEGSTEDLQGAQFSAQFSKKDEPTPPALPSEGSGEHPAQPLVADRLPPSTSGSPAIALSAVGSSLAEPSASQASIGRDSGEPSGPTGARTIGPSVRVDVDRLDTLMELVGELVIDRERIEQITARWQAASPRTGILRAELNDVSLHLKRTLDELRDEVMQSRMVPLASVLRRLPRILRDLARASGKQVELQIHGEETELDRAMIDELADPLMHLVRNAVDHGIELPASRRALGKPEVGVIVISARPDENQILIELTDDGKGIDVTRLREVAVARKLLSSEVAARTADEDLLDLIFVPGFSTAESVTEVSGRGVGMDIVRSRIERVNGSIAVTTSPNEGTRFVIRLPLTLAIIRGLLVTLRERPYAIPLTAVAEVLRISREQVRSVGRRPATEIRGEILPLVWLDELLDIPPREEDNRAYIAVLVRAGGRRVGVVVDGLMGEQDVVIKPLGAFVGNARAMAGATILVDGRVCPILNIAGLLAAGALNRGEPTSMHIRS